MHYIIQLVPTLKYRLLGAFLWPFWLDLMVVSCQQFSAGHTGHHHFEVDYFDQFRTF